MAKKDIYTLDMVISVKGDGETKNKLKATEKFAEQTEKKMQRLNRIKATPSVRINDRASSTIDKINRKSSLLNKVIKSTATVVDRATPVLDRIRSKATIFNRPINTIINAKDKASETVNNIKSKIQNLKAATIISLNMRADPAIRAIALTRNKLGELSNKLNSIAGKTYKAAVELKDNASPQLQTLDNKITELMGKFAAIAAAGAMAFGGFGVGESLKAFAEFEKGLSNVKAVTGATKEQMKQLESTAINLGESTAWSALEVTQAEELLGQAGFSVKETISALPGLLNLASAGGLDLASATDIAVGSLKAFNLNANDSAHVANVLALSASATNSDVTDLGETLKYVAPVSQALGISFEDTAAAAGLLSNANIKGSQAGTILRQTMARLASPTKEAAGLMEKYGINAFDAQGNMKPLSSLVDGLNSSLKGLTSQQKADVISTIFGTESMSGVLALMNQGGESLGKLSKRLEGTKDAAKKMADTKLDNLAGQFEALDGAIGTVKIKLGKELAPYTKDFAKWLLGKMPEISGVVVGVVGTITKTFPKILQVFKNLVPVIAGATAALLAFKTVMLGVSIITTIVPVLSNIAFAFAAVAGGAATVGEAMLFVMGPIGWIALGIGLLVAIGVALYQNWDTIKSKATELKNKFIELKTGAIDKVKEGFSSLKEKILDLKDNVIDSAIKKFDQFKQTLKDNEDQIKTISTVLGVIFGPALLQTGVQAAIAGTVIATKFTVSLVKAGIEAIISSAKLTGSFVLSLMRVSAQAIITGLTITGNLILSFISLGAQAITTSAIMIGNFLLSLVRISAQAIITGATITASLIFALISYAAQGWATVACIAAQTVAWTIQQATMFGAAAAAGVVTAAQWALNAAMAANPIGLVIILVAGLVAGLIYLWKTSSSVRGAVSSFFSGLKQWGVSACNAVIGALNSMISLINKIPMINIPSIPTVGGGSSKASSKSSGKGGGSKKTTKHATGGIFTTPHYALFAEEPGGEAVIPLNGKRRDRAVSLWQETGEKLGMVNKDRYRNAGNQSSFFIKGDRNRFTPKEQNYEENNSSGSSEPRFQVCTPRVAGGAATIDVNVEVNNSFDNNVDEDYIVQETTKEVGKKLKEALDNIN